jgi:hypothetical protein
MAGKRHTPEAKEKISQAMMGRKHTLGRVLRIGDIRKGVPHSRRHTQKVIKNRSKWVYTITNRHGVVERTTVLSQWCDHNIVSYYQMREALLKGKTYQGYTITRKLRKKKVKEVKQ